MDYTPIASKSFGTDQETGLEKRILAHSFHCDAKANRITVICDVVLMSPTGKIVSIVMPVTYRRENIAETPTINASLKFDQLRNSQIGQGIIQLIQGDINAITSFNTIADDLKQTVTNKPPIEQ